MNENRTNFTLPHCHLDLHSLIEEIWIWRPCLPNKEVAPQDQDARRLSYHEWGGGGGGGGERRLKMEELSCQRHGFVDSQIHRKEG